jgi:hypothetical protein
MTHPKLRILYAGTGSVMLTACTAVVSLRLGSGSWGVQRAVPLDWISVGTLATAVLMAIIYFATSESPDRDASHEAPSDGNYAGRDNLGNQFNANKIEYYEASKPEPPAAVLPEQKQQPILAMAEPEIPKLKLDFVRMKIKIQETEGAFRHDEQGSECVCVMVHNVPAGLGKLAFDAESVFASLTFEHGASRSIVNRACWLNEEDNETRIDVSEMRHILIGFPLHQESTWVSVNNPNRADERIVSDWSRTPLLDLEKREVPWIDGLPLVVDVRVISSAFRTKNMTFAHRRMRLERHGFVYLADWIDEP